MINLVFKNVCKKGESKCKSIILENAYLKTIFLPNDKSIQTDSVLNPNVKYNPQTHNSYAVGIHLDMDVFLKNQIVH